MLIDVLVAITIFVTFFALLCVGLLSVGCVVFGEMWHDLSQSKLGSLIVPKFLLAKRNRVALASFAAVSWAVAVTAVVAPPRYASTVVERQLDAGTARRLVGEWQQALLTKDRLALDEIMAENFIFENPFGGVMTKVAVLSALPSESFKTELVRNKHTIAVEVGEAAAVLTNYSFVYVGPRGWLSSPLTNTSSTRIRFTYRQYGGQLKLASLTLD